MSKPKMAGRGAHARRLPIRRSRKAPHLFYAFGHQHRGLTLAPVTALLVRDLIEGREPSLALAPFAIERFAQP